MAAVTICHLKKFHFLVGSRCSIQKISNFSYISQHLLKYELFGHAEKMLPSKFTICVSNNLTSNNGILHHKYSTGVKENNDDEKPKRSLPPLMAFPEIVWPSILKTIKSWILVNFIIRPYFDREFNMPEFVAGTKHAIQVVSTNLASGELKNLNGLVSSDIISQLKKPLSEMSVAQRNELNISKDDIYFSFPYQVGVMFDETNDEIQKRWVEITMVFHVLKGLREMQERGQPPPINLGLMPEYRDKISICNYRFIKEFTKGRESDWTINIINHFKPSDFIDE